MTDQTPESCMNCKFGAPAPQNIKARICRNEPPKMFMVPAPQGVQMLSDYPPVQASGWCGRWERKP